MKFIVTGSAGFIGYHLSKRLLNEGHNVIGIDNHSPDYDILLKERHTGELKSYSNFEFIKLDITNEAIDTLLRTQNVDYVIHLAAKDMYYGSPTEIEYTPYLFTNVIGTSKAFELAKKLNAKKFIFSSTFSVYGGTKKELLTEKKILPRPISPHGASKIAAEEVVHFLSNYYKLPSVILRLGSVYGPEMRPHTAVPFVIDRLKSNKPLDFYNNETTRDYIYIDDVVEYIIAVFNKRIKFQIINVASGKSISMVDLSYKIANEMGKNKSDIQFVQHQKDFKNIIQKDAHISIKRAEKILRYTPKINLDEGIKRTVTNYLKNEYILTKSTHH